MEEQLVTDTSSESTALQLYLKSRLTIMNDSDKKLPVYLIGIGENNNENTYRKNGFFYDQILLIETGEGILEYNNEKHLLTPKSCVLIPKHTPHSYIAKTPPFKLYWICFGGSYLSELLTYFNMTSIFHFSAPNYSKLRSLHNELYQLTEHHYDPTLFSKYVYSILVDFHRQKNITTVSVEKISQMSDIKSYIDNLFIEDISLDTLAEKFNISKYKTCRSFPDIYGISFHKYFIKLRLQYAKHLLISTDNTILSIAEQCGFSDNVYFGKVFKKYEYVSPQQYRNRCK